MILLDLFSPQLLDLQAHNAGLLGLQEDLRYWHEERTTDGNPWPALNWLPPIMKARMIDDIELRLIATIRGLEREIRE